MSTTTIASTSAIMMSFATGVDFIFYGFVMLVVITLVIYFINLGGR